MTASGDTLPQPTRLQAIAERTSQGTAVAALLVAIFWSGGVYTETLAALWLLALVGWVAALRTQRPRPLTNPFAWLFFGLGGIACLQLVPLPRVIVAMLHANAVAVADIAARAAGTEPPAMLCLATAPSEAAYTAGVYLLAAATSLTAGAGWMQTLERRRASKLLLGIAYVILVAGLIWVCSRLPWTSELPNEVVRVLHQIGPFNANHMAGLLTAGLGIALGYWHQHALDSTRVNRGHAVLALVLGLTAAFVPSRGGYLGALFVVVVAKLRGQQSRPGLRVREEILAKQARTKRLLQTLIVVCVIVMIALPTISAEVLPSLASHPIDDFQSGDGKLALMAQLSDRVWDGWILGQGSGSLPVAAMMLPPHQTLRLEYVENLVADKFVDFGIPISLLFFATLGNFIWQQVKQSKHGGLHHAAFLAIVGLLFHDLVDFVLLLPAGVYTLLAAGILLEPFRVTSTREWLVPRKPTSASTLTAAAIALLLAGFCVSTAWQSRELEIGSVYDSTAREKRPELVRERLFWSHHAWYRLGRDFLDQRDVAAAERALTAATALKPASRHAQYARLVAAIERRGEIRAPLDHLLSEGDELLARGARICAGSEAGRAELEAALIANPSHSDVVGKALAPIDPPLVYALAQALSEAHPGRRFGIEVALAELYLQRGATSQVYLIAAGLLNEPRLMPDGIRLSAALAMRSKDYKQAHALYGWLCTAQGGETRDCEAAMRVSMQALEPAAAVTFVRGLYPYVQKSAFRQGVYWDALAQAYYRAQDYDEAYVAARRALGYHMNFKNAHAIGVKSLVHVGDVTEAENWLRRMRDRKIDDDLAAQLAADVTRIQDEAIEKRIRQRYELLDAP
ncbi:MAG: hypothetical protein H6747_10955 [Deltaproteobacteria bacterium]|nr:hypothetical protein [Deltaproteobacteria bacterium]